MRRNFWLGFIVILIVIGVGAYISLPKTTAFWGRPTVVSQGLDLQGGVELKYQMDLSKTPAASQSEAIQSTEQVIERRVNSTGVSEPVIQPITVGNTQAILVDLPGLKDTSQAIALIGKTAELEFKELDPASTSTNPIWKSTGLTGKQLSQASVSFDQNTNAPQISLQFNSDGAQLFGDITSRNIGNQVGIFLDGTLLSAPTVNSQIAGGQAVITGQFTLDEVKQDVNLLNSGALAVPLTLVSQQTVGATLGAQSVKASLVAGVVGLLLVVLFMIFNYRLAGLIATAALFGYSVLTLALFKLIPVTITLSGIAGFILSIGMAVDANILIFERMREELKKGKNFTIALEESFRRAWPSVRDSNMATLITCAILYFNTTGLVRGFALTLALGVIVSLFSSITTSRALLRAVGTGEWGKKYLTKI